MSDSSYEAATEIREAINELRSAVILRFDDKGPQFASAALTGLLSRLPWNVQLDGRIKGALALLAWEMADEMVKQGLERCPE